MEASSEDSCFPVCVNKEELERIKERQPLWETRGRSRRYFLSEDHIRIVRLGSRSAAMPQMVYSEDVNKAVLSLYGKEYQIG